MSSIKNKLIELQGAKKQLKSGISQLESDVATLDEKGVDIQKALTIAQQVAENTQKQLTYRLDSLVSNCIQSIFGYEYDFRVEFLTKRGKTEARLITIENGLEMDDLPNMAGGGLCDIVSFALRLACYLLDCKNRRRTILLDEPVKNLRQYADKFYELIEKLSSELGIQFIITPSPADIYPDSFNIIKVGKVNGVSFIEQE